LKTKFAVTPNPLLGLFAHEVELIDEMTESALQARENDLLPSQPKPNTIEQLPMNISTKLHYFSPEEYLELERHSPFKHEYQRGLVYAMAGGKKSHGQITSNLNMLLGNHLANTPCSVYVADMKVNIAMPIVIIILIYQSLVMKKIEKRITILSLLRNSLLRYYRHQPKHLIEVINS